MTFQAVVEHFTHHCRLAHRVRNAEAALAHEREARKATLDHYRQALLCLDAAMTREEALKREVADLTLRLECVGIDLTEAERALEAMTAGLRWFAEGAS